MNKMKSIANQSKNIIISLSVVLMIFVFSSCATKVAFLTSAVVPAAEGTVSIKVDGNKNYTIKVQVVNLANSQNLTPPRNVYVLWMLTDNYVSKNIGQIVSSSGSMSSKLKASFETVSANKPNKIFITAEDVADILYPSNVVVLTTDFISLK
jgi:hypothetical protein